jgi:glycosyltransferase involved in cell wall biosynthesis
MSIAVVQLGARMHYAVPRILHAAGRLERLYTDLCATQGWPRLLAHVPRRLQPGPLARLAGRLPGEVPAAKISSFPGFAVRYAMRLRAARSASSAMATYLWAGARFDQLVLAAGLGEARAVYGFNTASEIVFEEAARRGVRRILEQTIAPRGVEVALLEGATDVDREWRAPICRDPHLDAYVAREAREWALADTILCPSAFVRDALVGCGAEPRKCAVVPYGVDLASYACAASQDGARAERAEIVILFVGGIGLRKGVPYLLRAMERLRDLPARCRIVGPWRIDPAFARRASPPNVEWIGPIARRDMAAQYAAADLFCLPSLCEGSATATYEALAAGLPVVTTPNSGSLVRDGEEGFVVPACDDAALALALRRLCEDAALRSRMARAARERSAAGSLDAYAGRLLAALDAP